MRQRPGLDVSQLPMFAFGVRDPLFWGVMGLLAIESTMFAILVGSYFYLRQNFEVWPPTSYARESFVWSGLTTGLLLLSVIPVHYINRSALAAKLRGMRLGLVIAVLIGAAAVFCRAMEFASLSFRWDSNAHGSLVWLILGLHTLHTVTGTLENLVLAALLFIGPVEKRHRVDIHLNGLYWYFVVASWIPLYAIVYLGTGWLHR